VTTARAPRDPARPSPGAAEAHEGSTTSRAERMRQAGGAVAIVGLGLAALPASPLWLVLTGITAALAVGLPLVLAGTPRAAAVAVPLVVVLAAVLAGSVAYERATGSLPARDRVHDGGVLVTRAAADDLLHGRNPYTDDYQRVLPESWREVQGHDGGHSPNPVRHHFPYLPAAAVVHVPFVAAADALGVTWDPRILGWLALVAALVVVARRPEPAWARVGALLGVGSAFSVVYLAWGTNDLFAASLCVLALAWAKDRPGWAGATLAVALSAKVLLLALVPPLALAVFLVADGGGATAAGTVGSAGSAGWAALRRWWTLPAVLAVTCLPALVADPSAFVDDTVWFNLGRSKPIMPTSGIGLPAVWPDLFHGPLLGVITLAGVALAFVAPLWAVRRWPSVWTAGAAAGIGLLGLMVPARTFQTNYLVLVATLAPLAWLALTDRPPHRS
jgi:hypothetical protein